MATKDFISAVGVEQLASVVRNRLEKVLVIDSRSFLEFNTCHVANALNVCCSKIVKRRLQQDKVSVKDFLKSTCNVVADESFNIIVYDQGSVDYRSLSADCFLYVLLSKLSHVFSTVNLLQGGFLEFQSKFPTLCEDKTRKHVPLSSLSQPCLSISSTGPTRILPFLYLGSQQDANDKGLLTDHNIIYVINVSTACPKPDFIPDEHFLRIGVNDNYSEKLLPHFPKAFNFVDKARETNGCVLIHCLAGISRSPTIAIAYVMRHMRMTSDDAYRYVKSKRPTISPNFNFLGQLLEYERQLRKESVLEGGNPQDSGKCDGAAVKRHCRNDMRLKLELEFSAFKYGNDLDDECGATPDRSPVAADTTSGAISPTTALSKLNFGNTPTTPTEERGVPSFPTVTMKKAAMISRLPKLREEDAVADSPASGFQCTRSKSASNVQNLVTAFENEGHNNHGLLKERRLSFDTNFLDSSALWCKSKLFHDVKGIPLSSLRNICFTSCQTSAPPPPPIDQQLSSDSGSSSASTTTTGSKSSSPVWPPGGGPASTAPEYRLKRTAAKFTFLASRVTVVENL